MHRRRSLLHTSRPGGGIGREAWAKAALVPLTVCLCASLVVRYGYYGDHHLALGPNSSCMVKVSSSLFVRELWLRGEAGSDGVVLYMFDEAPRLSEEKNWTASRRLQIDSYDRQGISIWLNKGSRIWVRWRVVDGRGNFQELLLEIIKGGQKFERPHEYYTTYGRVEFGIEEDDIYYIGVANLNARAIVVAMELSVSSKMYDTAKSSGVCTLINHGLCKMKLVFPGAHYLVLTTPDINVSHQAWHVTISFVARLLSYIVIVGLVVVTVICLILRCLGACRREATVAGSHEETRQAETDPIVSTKDMPCMYGTAGEEDPEISLCCSSQDLYDGKICVICYDAKRSCFFTPCGHCATCIQCANRIMEDETRTCPVCRRLIHRVKKLVSV